MTKNEFNQKVIAATENLTEIYNSAFERLEDKFKVAEKFINKLNSPKIICNFDTTWGEIPIYYTMDSKDIYSPLRILWQIVEDIDEEIECAWGDLKIDEYDLELRIHGRALNNTSTPIKITVFFEKSNTCKIEYFDEKITVKRTKITC